MLHPYIITKWTVQPSWRLLEGSGGTVNNLWSWTSSHILLQTLHLRRTLSTTPTLKSIHLPEAQSKWNGRVILDQCWMDDSIGGQIVNFQKGIEAFERSYVYRRASSSCVTTNTTICLIAYRLCQQTYRIRWPPVTHLLTALAHRQPLSLRFEGEKTADLIRNHVKTGSLFASFTLQPLTTYEKLYSLQLL